MEDDESILSNLNNNPSVNEVNELNKEENLKVDDVVVEKEEEVAGLVAGQTVGGGCDDLQYEVKEVGETNVELDAEEADGGGEEKGCGGGGLESAVETEGKGVGLKVEEDFMGNFEMGASDDGSGGMRLNKEVIAVAKSDEVVVSACASVLDHGTGLEINLPGENKSIINGTEHAAVEHAAVEQGDEVVVAENLMVSDTTYVVEELSGSSKVELHQSLVIEKNASTDIEQMTTMEEDMRAVAAIGNEDGVVHKLDDPQTADCDDTMNDGMDGVIPVAQEKMEMDICAESKVMMGEGSKYEVPSTPSHPLVGTEAIAVAKAEKDEVKEAEVKENFVVVSEEEKQVELVEADVSQCRNDEVKGEVEENDEFKGNSSTGDDRLDADKEVDINVEECNDSKEVDSESTVSESLADKSGNADEVDGKQEGGGCDIRMETEANTEANTLDSTKDEEPDVTGDSDELQTPQDEEMVDEEEANAETEVETETGVAESGKAAGDKRKRKNRSPSKTKSAPKARKTIEEDVCYICYDGGDLVLCDRRGCPKAYHSYCVNRDEAFFQGKSRWNCGWHLCSICEKNALYFCYTCPFSLCKGCIKDAVILCVRGKKGFCETCMKVVKLLENNEQGVKNDQVDFDDKGSWGYLYRDYFTELKAKLSLSGLEIAEARSPFKGLRNSAGKDDKRLQGNLDVKQESPEAPLDPKDDAELNAENFNENEEPTKPRKEKLKKRRKTGGKGHTSPCAAEVSSNEDGPVGTEWASKELLEFVMHMKSGDRSILSEYDVQALLLEYIKRNNLRDPRQKSRIICDSRLKSLFGKSCVGHFEMLKLLESHFFLKEDAHTDDIQGSVVNTNSEQLEVDGNANTPKGTNEKKRKSRKKGNRRGPQSNLEDYAAIDIHNMSLIYLRRKLVEDLLEDSETFQDKVAGTFVRIRISGSVQKQELYRLVQVLGTSKVADPYKVGKRSTNIMIDILNLNKTEVIPIDTISNQDFTEEECKRLRQSIKCGLINRLTVGDILDKATELQAAKVNDWLETEVVRLTHLCDRASEKGRKKELRECVEKLQLLKTPEERQRRLDEIPEIHADPKMDPNYESEDDVDVDEHRQDANTKIRGPGSRGERGQISPGSDILYKDLWSRGAKYSNKNFELDRNLSSKNLLNKGVNNTTPFGEMQGETSWNQERDRSKPESSNLDRFGSNLSSATFLGNSHDVPKTESLSLSASKPVPALAEALDSSPKMNESEKNWHYKDPSGRVQGPFSIVQLRKWSNTGYFPAGLKVWRTTEKQEDSILLTDALSGKFLKESTAAASALPSTFSANLTSIMASLEHAREQQDRDKLRLDLDASGNLTSHIVSPGGQAVKSVEHPKLSTEKWSRSESSSHPSPSPILNNAGFTREGGSLSSPATYFGRNGALPSPTAISPEYQGHSSTPTSGLRSSESLRASENEPFNTGSSGVQVGHLVVSNTLPNMQAVDNSEARALQMHGNVAVAQDSFAPHTVNDQNCKTGTLGWSSAQSHIVEANAAIPVQPPIQAYAQWGNIPASGYTHPGNFPQGNQPNMQLPGPRAENPNPNPNLGFGGMQGNQSTVWMGVPHMNANANWGASHLQGPPHANQNMGWAMPPGNHMAPVQGQLPAGANPGWTAGMGNPPAQGLPPTGNLNQSWVSPQTGNALSNVHIPASGSGWSPAPSNLGAPVPGMVPGNGNQGFSTPPGNPGHWGADQNHSGSKFSSPRDQGSHGRNSGYGGDRSRNRPSSFGNGRPGGPSRHSAGHRHIQCPYNQGGRCRKGASCDYLHS